VGRRIRLWLRMLGRGVKPLDTVARWMAVAVLLLGIAGITVTFVLRLPWPLTVVILIAVLLAVVLEGAYQIWDATDQERLSAEARRDAAEQELVPTCNRWNPITYRGSRTGCSTRT
jgi:ABC-type transport system involved in Fe-S cluster assembly fused permease/ATPase subunit